MDNSALKILEYQPDIDKHLSRREKKKLRREARKVVGMSSMSLKTIHPMTRNQQRTFDAFDQGQHLLLHGVAGTGKTFISLYLALKSLLQGMNDLEKVIIVRSIVPTRDMGFLPGNQREKAKVYESPYYAICSELFGRGDAYDVVKNKNFVEFMSTSYVRGTTLSDCVVIVDECQNLTFHELDSVITRAGDNCRIVFCGDFRQTDLLRENEKRGIMDFINVVGNMRSFNLIEFNEEDIVRSELVKEYILSKLKNGIHT